MKIGITYNLKSAEPIDPSLPDDFQEEFDSSHTIDSIANALSDLGHRVALLGEGALQLSAPGKEVPAAVRPPSKLWP